MNSLNDNLSTLSTNIKAGIEARLKDLHTAMPGIIQSFNSELQTISVQPAVRRIFKTEEEDKELLIPSDLPILINVPIVYPRGGGYSLTFPIVKGDECLLIFCERSFDQWHKFSGVRDPGAKRFHSLSDATAFVGLSSIPNKIPNYNQNNVQLKKDDGSVSITLTPNDEINISANDIVLAGNVTVSGSLSINGSSVTHGGTNIGKSHSHPYSWTDPGGSSTTGPPS